MLLLYQLVAEEKGISSSDIGGTIQNDVLKEYIARGTYIYPPAQSLRLITDIFTYCRAEIPKWNTISISGYHMAEAGATPVQEIAFTLANGIEYVRAAVDSGQDVDDFAPRLAFFFVSRTSIIEEVAKFPLLQEPSPRPSPSTEHHPSARDTHPTDQPSPSHNEFRGACSHALVGGSGGASQGLLCHFSPCHH